VVVSAPSVQQAQLPMMFTQHVFVQLLLRSTHLPTSVFVLLLQLSILPQSNVKIAQQAIVPMIITTLVFLFVPHHLCGILLPVVVFVTHQQATRLLVLLLIIVFVMRLGAL